MCAKIIMWSDEEDEFLKKAYPDTSVPINQIAGVLNKSVHAVKQRASLYKIERKKSTIFEDEQKKICPRCNLKLDFEEFNKNASKPYGISSLCRVCEKIYVRERNEASKVKRRERKEKERPDFKRCTRCKKVKSISEFYTHGGMCKICRNERNREIDHEQILKKGYNN